ncbi:MAG TPA: FtsX-like permease family protein [Longilinea sp.]|nr:FtsX-like permease family protein [Longilinea sp.]
MTLEARLAWRYLTSRKLRTFLTTLAVILGVMIMFGMESILLPMQQAFNQTTTAAANLVDLNISQVDGNPFSPAVLDTVQGIPGIARATGALQRNVILPIALGGSDSSLDGVNTLTITGVDPATTQSVRFYSLGSGTFLTHGNDDEVVITDTIARKMNLKVGDSLTLPSSAGNASFKVTGILTTVPGAADEAIITLPAAQQLFNQPDQINVIEALFAAGVNREAVEALVRQTLGSNFQIGALQAGSTFMATLELGQSIFAILGILAMIMGGFIIYNTFRTLIAERRHDLGLLRALGASRRTVIGIFVIEGFIQGVAGTALGLIAGLGLADVVLFAVQNITSQLLRMNLPGAQPTPQVTLIVTALGIGISLFSALFPALAAARVTPMQALHPESKSVYEQSNRLHAWIGLMLIVLAILVLAFFHAFAAISLSAVIFIAGLVLTAPALVKPMAIVFGWILRLWFPREELVAGGNLTRQPGRAAITASSVMISLAIIIAMIGLVSSLSAGFFNYLDKSMGTDFLIMPSSLLLSGGNVGAAPDLAQRLAQLPQVSAMTTLRVANSHAHGTSLQVVGIDPVAYPKISGLTFSSGDAGQAYAALAGGRAIIINGVFAAQSGVKAGDRLTLSTVNGDQSYQVVGIALDYLNVKLATAYISQASLAQDFNATSDMLFLVDIKPGTDRTAALRALQDVTKDYASFTLLDSQSFKQAQGKAFNGAMMVLYILEFALITPALVAMINTLAINVMERTREFGMLRAVGSTRKQIGRMVLAESLLLALLGSSLGILVGIVMGYWIVAALNISGFVMPYYFPAEGIFITLAVGLLFGILAADAPARRASRMEIVTALRYE